MASPTVFASVLAAGPGYFATSSSAISLTTGTKTFVTQAGLAYSTGARMRASSRANTNNYLEGEVASYASNSLVTVVSTFGGSGTFTDWNLNLAGQQGATGSTGATGATGAAGTNGTNGANGTNGTNGTNGAPGVAYTPAGTWTSVTTYTQGHEVSYTTLAYISLASGNVNQQPDVSPTWWQPLVGSASQWTTTNTDIYYSTGKVGIGGVPVAWQLEVIKDGGNAVAGLDSYTSFPACAVYARGARGSKASPTAIQSGDDVLYLQGQGYGSSTFGANANAQIIFRAKQTFTDTAKGMGLIFKTTPLGTNTLSQAMEITPSGDVVIVGTCTASAFSAPGFGAPLQFSSYAGSITGSIDGENLTFTLSSAPALKISVYLDGNRLVPTRDYTWTPASTSLVFVAGSVPQSGQTIAIEGW